MHEMKIQPKFKTSYGTTENLFQEFVESETKTSWFKTKRQKWLSPEIKQEFSSLMVIAVPMIITNVFQYSIPTVSNIMCGHLSKYEFDGASLANSMIGAFGLSVGIGLCTAGDTLFAQAYGSEDKKRVGLYLQRGLMVNSLVPLILWAFHLNVEPFFILLQQDPEVSRLASIYMRYFMVGLLFNYVLLARYIQNQNCVLPPLFFGLIGNVFNASSQYISIYLYGYGIEASALCQAASFFIMFVLTLLYIIITKFYKETWNGWTIEAFFDWDKYFSLALAGVGHIALQTMCYEAATFFSGIMGVTELGAQIILHEVDMVTYVVGVGIGIAANIRIGQYLGSNNPDKAKVVFRVALYSIVVYGLFSTQGLLLLKDFIPFIFTNDKEVIELATTLLPIIAVITLTENILAVLDGALRGCGKQKTGAFVVAFAFIVIGVPIGVVLGFVAKLNILGLWIGICIGLVICLCIIGLVIFRQDWQQQANEALSRLMAAEILTEIPVETEKTYLLSNDPEDLESQGIKTTHIRTPSQPYGCSTDLNLLPPKREQIKRGQAIHLLTKRALTTLAVLLFFLAAVVIFLMVPREAFITNSYNSTMMVSPSNQLNETSTIAYVD